MKNTLKTLTFFTLILLNSNSLAQIGGISASKLATLCVEPVPAKSIEFEPVFGFAYAKEFWDTDGNLASIFSTTDSVEVFSAMGFRFSYGVTIERAENFLIVLNMPIDVMGKNIYRSVGLGFALTISIK